ncbi:flagellar transcriptional regulator FlhD [Paraburkholderia sp. A1RI-2L]|uniref:flagellar transcriptional regulator FlhD n=1 Tax=Paraburkholderia sp. A1RI-2L TaxID=3028367 RepID=UPI003B7BD6E0
MMNSADTLQSIQELNLSYLALAQRLLHDDRPAGMFRLGLSEQVADLLAGLTLAQIVKLSACNQLLCFFRINDHQMLSVLATPGKDANKHIDIAHTHAAVLLAGQPAEQFA